MDFDTADLFANKSAEEELQVLRSIYTENELQEERTKEHQRLLFKINPDFGSSDEVVSRRYCSLQLEIDIDCKYPACSPIVKIKNPRGLIEEEVRCLETQISSYLLENEGQLVLYDIIQLAQDFSVSEEVPTLPCSICLNKFLSDDSIFVTSECHHHFHSHCLGRYVEYCVKEKRAEREILPAIEKDSIKDDICCPLCRCLITCPSTSDLLNSTPPEIEMDSSFYDWSHLANPIDQKFHDLYEKQKLQGGLIDHEEERKRMLLTDDLKICIPINSAGPKDESSAPSTSKTKSEIGGHPHYKQFYSKEFKNTAKNKRHYYPQNNRRFFYGHHYKSTPRNDEAKQSTSRRHNDIPPPSNPDSKNPDV